MIQTSYPRTVNAEPIQVGYEGKTGPYFVFRLSITTQKSLDVLGYRNRMQDWLMRKTSAYKLGNNFGASKGDPAFPFPNPSGKDLFVLLPTLADVRLFEDRYAVTGFSPTMAI